MLNIINKLYSNVNIENIFLLKTVQTVKIEMNDSVKLIKIKLSSKSCKKYVCVTDLLGL